MERITPKMLSKELKELEINGIVERLETNSLIEYKLTDSGKNMIGIIDAMISWGQKHRELALLTLQPPLNKLARH
ncbi:MAG: winged helix-turn-helix transcriptional regulator [Arcticibacter sp.]